MSSIALPVTFELRLKAIRRRRAAARQAGVLRLAIWITGTAAAAMIAGGAVFGSR